MQRGSRILILSFPLCLLVPFAARPVFGQAAAAPPPHQHAATHEQGAPPERLGTVHFETSCAPAVAADFNRAVALLHSFWFSAAIEGFNGVLAKDPSCTIADWGIALSRWGNPFGPTRTDKSLQAGLDAIHAATAAPPKTPRERAYVAAVEQLFKDYGTIDQRHRVLAYEAAMEQVSAANPSDKEAAIFYALALAQSAPPTDKTYANQLKAGAMLEKLFAEQPDHPGLAHYIIHSYDVPALAPRALDAATRYAAIAPSAPHALHMPSHTFTRVGAWDQSIVANIASAEAARKDKGATAEELHATDYEVYAYLQTAQDRAALKLVEALPSIAARLDVDAAGAAAPGTAGLFAQAAIPARYALERGAWADAARLTVITTQTPYTDAITYFARALGAARGGQPEAARPDLDQLTRIRDGLRQAKNDYWAGQVDIQWRAASAWVTYAGGTAAQKTEALTALREAAALEDATEKAAVTPGPLAPARELLAEMLLDSQDYAGALTEFETTLQREPRRFRSVYGAARAGELAKQGAKATKYYQQLIEICRHGDAEGRAELKTARGSVRPSL
jgi:tetratricopeptide (TPR) repeat protein